MSGGEVNPHPIQLLVNYWEVRPAAMGARLDRLMATGVNHIATFIPWQAVESDINHTLLRFLQAVAERKMTLWLILTPEVGVHFPNSGLPKDLFNKPDAIARHPGGAPIPITLPPNLFHLPSLTSPEFTKRYHGFLTRIDGLLAEVARTQPGLLDCVTAVMTGSYFKYYRSQATSAEAPYSGETADTSAPAAVAFRTRVDQYFASREFSESNPAAAGRWKTRALEEVNRRWFSQQTEEVFRMRSGTFVRRRAPQAGLKQVELHTPEADPAFAYSQFLSLVSGGSADGSRLSALVDEAATRESAAAPFVHWTGLGPFRSLSDSEKQFLILKSLLLMGSRSGGILIDESEWFSLSVSFRARTEALARSLAHGEFRLRTRAVYLAPHLWSSAGTLWDEVRNRLGAQARIASTPDVLPRLPDVKLLMVDPTVILTKDLIWKLTGWARGGRMLMIPRSPLYTDSARSELEQALASCAPMEINLGVPYKLFNLGEGRVLLYDLPEGLSMAGEALATWQKFLASALALAELQAPCTLSDSRLSVIPLDRKDGSSGLFVVNGSGRSVSADILFPLDVTVGDLASRLAQAAPQADPDAVAPVAPASRFSLDVPPLGILPLSVHGLGDDLEERRQAQRSAPALRQAAQAAAASELPGLDEGAEAPWN